MNTTGNVFNATYYFGDGHKQSTHHFYTSCCANSQDVYELIYTKGRDTLSDSESLTRQKLVSDRILPSK